MTIYFDISAAVHRRAGLDRYAEILTRARRAYCDSRQSFSAKHYRLRALALLKLCLLLYRLLSQS